MSPKPLIIGISVVLLAISITPAFARDALNVTLWAGARGSAGSTNGTLSQARFIFPSWIAVAASGNIYVVDNFTIRKISGGQVSRLAGSGASGYVDQTGDLAAIGNTGNLTIDAAENIYFFQDCALRRVTTGGVVTTVSGQPNDCRDVDGPAASARFSLARPQIAIGPSNRIYLAGQGTMRFVNLDGSAGTVVGSDGNPMIFPSSLGSLTASTSAVYVVSKNQILQVVPGSGYAAIAGLQFGSPYVFPRFARDGSAEGAVLTPWSLAIDSSGNLFFLDRDQHNSSLIRVLTTTGIVKTLAGRSCWGDSNSSVDGIGCEARLDGLTIGSLAAAPTGEVYFTEANQFIIRRGVMTTVDTPSCLPTGDLVWQRTTGELRLSHLYQTFIYQEITRTANSFPEDRPPGPDWDSTVGVLWSLGVRRCFAADIAFRNRNTGDVKLWTFQWSQSLLGTVPDLDYKIEAVADLNGDEAGDLIWRHATNGSVVIWTLNNRAFISAAMLPPTPDLQWKIAGTGDFDGDGREDIFWSSDVTRQTAIWLMDGETIKQAGFVERPNAGWSVAGIGDFDGDFKADVLWYNTTTRDVAVWLMNGFQIASAGLAGQVGSSDWHIRGVADYDGDGRADIYWRNTATGDNVIWFMRGTALQSAGFSLPQPDLTWDVIGSK